MREITPLAEDIRGQFLLAELRIDTRKSQSNPHVSVVLDNAQGRYIGHCLPRYPIEYWQLEPGEVVQVIGLRRRTDQDSAINIQSMKPVAEEAVENGAAVLPLHLCPKVAHAALARLVDLNSSLGHRALRGFLTRVLRDPAIGIPFIRSRAAWRYHHAYPGGLLVHSTEMLDLAAHLAIQAEPKFPLAPGIVQLAYLLHDLGKVDTVGETRGTVSEKTVGHTMQTFVRLGTHLAWLEGQWPAGSRLLTSALGYCARSAKERPHDAWMGAQAIIFLDRLSVARDCSAQRSNPKTRLDQELHHVGTQLRVPGKHRVDLVPSDRHDLSIARAGSLNEPTDLRSLDMSFSL